MSIETVLVLTIFGVLAAVYTLIPDKYPGFKRPKFKITYFLTKGWHVYQWVEGRKYLIGRFHTKLDAVQFVNQRYETEKQEYLKEQRQKLQG
jgi:hypothetical protein